MVEVKRMRLRWEIVCVAGSLTITNTKEQRSSCVAACPASASMFASLWRKPRFCAMIPMPDISWSEKKEKRKSPACMHPISNMCTRTLIHVDINMCMCVFIGRKRLRDILWNCVYRTQPYCTRVKLCALLCNISRTNWPGNCYFLKLQPNKLNDVDGAELGWFLISVRMRNTIPTFYVSGSPPTSSSFFSPSVFVRLVRYQLSLYSPVL